MDRRSQSRLSLTLRHGRDASVEFESPDITSGYPAFRLDCDGGFILIRPSGIGIKHEAVTAEHVEFARQLAEVAAQYSSEMERAYKHDLSMEEAA